ncbi:MAG: serine/threonine protein kinase [Lachnospiraceae bacterium]|nr:serine/threonine protein kinase [Lachnospiraceae bacterium]
MDINSRQEYPLTLPKGSVLCGKYEIRDVLGEGGFGITYTAVDKQANRVVAIKEYLPQALATREGRFQILSYSKERQTDFEYGKESFIEEAKTLAEFIGNPGIVRVHSYFEENGTAYFVMDYLEGQTLQKYLQSHGGKLECGAAWALLKPVADALSAVHAKGIIHRDVKPDNIFITKDGNVKLIDFGAARYSLGNKTQSLDIVLTHGFAPTEQYMRHARQGPYTDIYAFAATYYYVVTGKIPPDSVERMDGEDSLIPPRNLGIHLPPGKEEVLLKALSVRTADRYQSMAEFSKAFGYQTQPKPPQPQPEPQPRPQPQPPEPKLDEQTRKKLNMRIKDLKFWSGAGVVYCAVFTLIAIGVIGSDISYIFDFFDDFYHFVLGCLCPLSYGILGGAILRELRKVTQSMLSDNCFGREHITALRKIGSYGIAVIIITMVFGFFGLFLLNE